MAYVDCGELRAVASPDAEAAPRGTPALGDPSRPSADDDVAVGRRQGRKVGEVGIEDEVAGREGQPRSDADFLNRSCRADPSQELVGGESNSMLGIPVGGLHKAIIVSIGNRRHEGMDERDRHALPATGKSMAICCMAPAALPSGLRRSLIIFGAVTACTT